MSSTSTPSALDRVKGTTHGPRGTPSPVISPMHDPRQKKAVVQVPMGGVLGGGNANPIIPGQTSDPSSAYDHANHVPGLGHKALLAKKFVKANKPNLSSPTDQMQSPTSQKLAATKKRHYQKGKPISLASSFLAQSQAQSSPAGKSVTNENENDKKHLDEDGDYNMMA